MKSYNPIALFLLLIGSASFSFGQGVPQLVTVDLERVFNEYYKVQEAQDAFSKRVEKADEEMQNLLAEMRTLQEELEGLVAVIKSPSMTDEKKEEARGEAERITALLQNKNQDAQKFRARTQQTLNQRKQNLIALHMEDIRGVVAGIAKTKKATLVLNAQANFVVYVDPDFDITDSVIESLNASK
ncbi:MAG: OmpH family outer membrane protein [Puniceicoccaceae bacterium]